MDLDIENQLLLWIGDEVQRKREEGRQAAVPIHLLLVQLAAYTHDGCDVTESVELSLQTFDRATLYRTLRQMYSRGLVAFVDSTGKAIHSGSVQQGLGAKFSEQSELSFVSLSEDGLRLYLHKKSQEEQEESEV